jgi:hypothetical protein
MSELGLKTDDRALAIPVLGEFALARASGHAIILA